MQTKFRKKIGKTKNIFTDPTYLSNWNPWQEVEYKNNSFREERGLRFSFADLWRKLHLTTLSCWQQIKMTIQLPVRLSWFLLSDKQSLGPTATCVSKGLYKGWNQSKRLRFMSSYFVSTRIAEYPTTDRAWMPHCKYSRCGWNIAEYSSVEHDEVEIEHAMRNNTLIV